MECSNPSLCAYILSKTDAIFTPPLHLLIPYYYRFHFFFSWACELNNYFTVYSFAAILPLKINVHDELHNKIKCLFENNHVDCCEELWVSNTIGYILYAHYHKSFRFKHMLGNILLITLDFYMDKFLLKAFFNGTSKILSAIFFPFLKLIQSNVIPTLKELHCFLKSILSYKRDSTRRRSLLNLLLLPSNGHHNQFYSHQTYQSYLYLLNPFFTMIRRV